MSEALIITFIVTLIPALVALGVSYYRSQEIYPLLYILSLYTFVLSVAYAIDIFALGRNGILLVLVGSALTMILVGRYLYE
jgi:hypothetical protein